MPASVDPHRFDFDLDRGIRAQVIERLEGSPLCPLQAGVGPADSGIYALYYLGELVYVGKASRTTTKSGRTLKERLGEHRRKIEKRENITLDDMACRFLVFVSDWWVLAAEYALIAHYDPPWNDSGFGSKTPGAGRPGTSRVSSWDEQFPFREAEG